MLTYEEITKSEAIKTYIIRADESLGALGFTEHSFAHVMHGIPHLILLPDWMMKTGRFIFPEMMLCGTAVKSKQ